MKKARDTDGIKTKVLLAALKDVAFDGWTDEVLAAAAKKAGVSKGRLQGAFPCGVLDLVLYFSAWANEEMLKKLAKKKQASMRVRDRIALGVRTRLEVLAPHRQAVAASLSYLARPPRNFNLPKLVWNTADAIWNAAGDESTDYNRYTKRFLLSGVLTATTLYWLNDNSDGFGKTWVFLDRRIANVLELGKVAGKFRGRR